MNIYLVSKGNHDYHVLAASAKHALNLIEDHLADHLKNRFTEQAISSRCNLEVEKVCLVCENVLIDIAGLEAGQKGGD